MGWNPFWDSTPTDEKKSDPTRNLDPSLREFLDKEQPQQQAPPQPRAPPPSWLSQTDAAPVIPKEAQYDDKPAVPAQSLYQDGRYAHIWKNYTPLADLEAAHTTEQDKLKDLVAYKETCKAELGRSALENCAFEHLEQQDCYRSLNIKSKFTMCRAESKVFTRCYTMQAKFMKALGFMAAVGNPDAEEEIQMHADKLYRQMLVQEKLIEEAKERGAPLPVFESPLSPRNVGAAVLSLPPNVSPEPTSKPGDRIPPKVKAEFMEKIKKMTPLEAAVEEAAFLAELEMDRVQAMKGLGYVKEEAENRQKRFEEGKPTIGDRILRATGWDKKRAPSNADGNSEQVS